MGTQPCCHTAVVPRARSIDNVGGVTQRMAPEKFRSYTLLTVELDAVPRGRGLLPMLRLPFSLDNQAQQLQLHNASPRRVHPEPLLIRGAVGIY
jgi:hypothetical protein